MLFRSLLCVCFVLCPSFIHAGETWSHFRGDAGDGRADDANLRPSSLETFVWAVMRRIFTQKTLCREIYM